MTTPWIDTINVLETTKGIPVPQYYDPNTGGNQPLQGQGNASSVVRGKWYQVGAGATTGSIPMETSTGLTLALSAASQTRMVGATVEMELGSTLAEATVTAVSSIGTLTLDSALPTVPSQGTLFRLIPPEQTSLTGSNATIGNVGIVGTLPTNVNYYDTTTIGTLAAGATYFGPWVSASGYQQVTIQAQDTSNSGATWEAQIQVVQDTSYGQQEIVSTGNNTNNPKRSQSQINDVYARILVWNHDTSLSLSPIAWMILGVQ